MQFQWQIRTDTILTGTLKNNFFLKIEQFSYAQRSREILNWIRLGSVKLKKSQESLSIILVAFHLSQ